VRRTLVMALGAALLASGCRSRGEDGEAGQATVGVRTAVALLQNMAVTVGGIGTVAPRPGRYAVLSAPAATRVARIYAVAGQAVRRGDSLVEFERAPFEAGARSAEARLFAAQHAYDRAARLADAGVVARKDVDQAAGDLAQAQVDAVTARRALELATLRAPLAGVVTSMTAVIGAPVDAAQTLLEIADPSVLDVLVSLAPADAAPVRPGAPVSLAAGEAAAAEVVGMGVVSDVVPAVDSATRAVTVRVRVTRTERPLRIGETVFGRIAVGTHPRAVTVPAEALVPDGEGFKVFVVDSAGVAHARPVTVGTRTGALVEITTGVAAGETVVTYGAYGVDDGARVVTAKP
jgi:membrane fusion protein (multidrug efflux system)